jgi:hypothetical protein
LMRVPATAAQDCVASWTAAEVSALLPGRLG